MKYELEKGTDHSVPFFMRVVMKMWYLHKVQGIVV